ncbi:hypothetical protein BDV33DRAFT_184607 [Aspergillus novoparasiticus]|uniref:Uncharacterized protein n=1 Tax=Aspergillus novoparasiticus TaxID=986946 RepID=A0A5N6E7F5_9EURO|nr:hypothetical protein BDV33DRAFT_184607 [Aspergillus novoparasiticus]
MWPGYERAIFDGASQLSQTVIAMSTYPAFQSSAAPSKVFFQAHGSDEVLEPVMLLPKMQPSREAAMASDGLEEDAGG